MRDAFLMYSVKFIANLLTFLLQLERVVFVIQSYRLLIILHLPLPLTRGQAICALHVSSISTPFITINGIHQIIQGVFHL